MSGYVITCPNCGTRYQPKGGTFGFAGRTVRCARCGTRWVAGAPSKMTPDPDALALADNQNEDPFVAAMESDIENGGSEGQSPAEKTGFQPPVPQIGADALIRDQAEREKLARRRRTIRIIWAVPIVLVLVAAIIAYFNRQAIVNRIPQMASVYQLIGIDVRVGGLDIDPPQARTILVDGAPVIRVESAVRNLTRQKKAVPLIELSLHDRDGVDLMQWYVETQPPLIDARGQLDFITEITDPPEGAVSLRYRFSVQDGSG
jgi:predicted Zn finger-like uncharacterized protein